MAYSRQQPSERYQELMALYRQMHVEGSRIQDLPPLRVFRGESLLPQLAKIKRLIARTEATTILDYGSGKGLQYELRDVTVAGEGSWESVLDYWDVAGVHCYDPCYEPFSALPGGRFDGVISTDVLEHCPEEDVPWIVAELFSFADKFVFANVACFPAQKLLPTGENAHCTIKPAAWWAQVVDDAAAGHDPVLWEFWLHFLDQGGTYSEQRLANFDHGE